jgi:hypothetical protein
MTYSQYSDNAYTGDAESIKNRISSNSNDSSSETSSWPSKFDIFTSKENSSATDFAVTEEHTLSEFNGSKLYLHHRPASNTGGSFMDIVPSDGSIDTGSTDLFKKSVTFSTLPTVDPFYITYTATADKIEDSHINAVQNSIMAIQSVLGVQSTASGDGTGIVTLPIVIMSDVGSLAHLQAIQSALPNVILARHLTEDFYISSTNDVDMPANNVTIWIGNTGTLTRDRAVLDLDSITVQATNTSGAGGEPAGIYIYSSNTGDQIGFSGVTEFASQVTVGLAHGSLITSFNDTVPGIAGAFYSGAAFRAHGGMWFGSGLSGNGSVTFVTVSGEAVTVIGAFDATDLSVQDESWFYGVTNLYNKVKVNAPGYFTTNNDVTLETKPNGAPSKIDGLDPSYANASLQHSPVINSSLTHSVRHDISEAHDSQGQNYKLHPQLGLNMYPLIGGWTYTGVVNYEKAVSGEHDNILLLSSSMTGIGDNFPSSAGTNLGGGNAPYGDYSTGLFNPGDTFIELDLAIGNRNRVSYPIYYHTPEALSAGVLTGVNVYVAADTNALADGTTLAGTSYRLYQPGNVPLDHLRADSDTSFSSATQPVVNLGNANNADYPNVDVSFITDGPWDGGSTIDGAPMHKRINAGSVISVNVLNALSKSIEGDAITGGSLTGVAYIYATSRPGQYSTQESTVQLRATPTPYGLVSQYVWQNGYDIQPGQHCPVGEVWASTTNGTNWSLVETASYRPDGFYDSGWIPMVEYVSLESTLTTIPGTLGRCLPILGSAADAAAEFAATQDNHNFWVEHNLGPVRGGLTSIDYQVWVGKYSQTADGLSPVAGMTGNNIYKRTSAGDLNLWSQPMMPYNAAHDFYKALDGTAGSLRDITSSISVRGIDSRFAMFSIDDSTTLESFNYIRIHIKRNR